MDNLPHLQDQINSQERIDLLPIVQREVKLIKAFQNAKETRLRVHTHLCDQLLYSIGVKIYEALEGELK